MRMWLVDPKKMCRKHLLGEHVELHMLVSSIKRGISLQGFVDNKLIDTTKIQARHEELAEEITRRGYSHKSPLQYEDKIRVGVGIVDPAVSMKELHRRCPDCKNIG